MDGTRPYHRALLVEDDGPSRSALERALSAYGVGRVNTAETLAAAKISLCDEISLLVASAVVAKESCLPLIQRACDFDEPPTIVVICRGAPSSLIFRIGRFGAVRACLEKPVSSRTLWQCLDSLRAERPQRLSSVERLPSRSSAECDADVLERLTEHYREVNGLTNAETEVLRCATLGLSRAKIARERGVSPNTLKTQIRALLTKCAAPTLESLVCRIRCVSERRDKAESQLTRSDSPPTTVRSIRPHSNSRYS